MSSLRRASRVWRRWSSTNIRRWYSYCSGGGDARSSAKDGQFLRRYSSKADSEHSSALKQATILTCRLTKVGSWPRLRANADGADRRGRHRNIERHAGSRRLVRSRTPFQTRRLLRTFTTLP